jgi:hypothetical protein
MAGRVLTAAAVFAGVNGLLDKVRAGVLVAITYR